MDAARQWGRRSLLAGVLACPALAPAEPAPAPPPPSPTFKSLGLPPRLKAYVAGSLTWSREGGERIGGVGIVGLYKDLVFPPLSPFGVSAEGYAGRVGSAGSDSAAWDGGVRFLATSRLLFLNAGVDWNARTEKADFLLAFTPYFHRGGLFGTGGHLRIEWLPGRGHSFNVGFQVPLESGLPRPLGPQLRRPRRRRPRPGGPRREHAGLPEGHGGADPGIRRDRTPSGLPPLPDRLLLRGRQPAVPEPSRGPARVRPEARGGPRETRGRGARGPGGSPAGGGVLDALQKTPPPGTENSIYYLTVGSKNQNPRSAFLDGETSFVVAGPWALFGYSDFILLTAATTWVENAAELKELIPVDKEKARRRGRQFGDVL